MCIFKKSKDEIKNSTTSLKKNTAKNSTRYERSSYIEHHKTSSFFCRLIIMRTRHTRLCRVDAQMTNAIPIMKVVDLTALWLMVLRVAHPVVLNQNATTTNPTLRVSLVAV